METKVTGDASTSKEEDKAQKENSLPAPSSYALVSTPFRVGATVSADAGADVETASASKAKKEDEARKQIDVETASASKAKKEVQKQSFDKKLQAVLRRRGNKAEEET